MLRVSCTSTCMWHGTLLCYPYIIISTEIKSRAGLLLYLRPHVVWNGGILLKFGGAKFFSPSYGRGVVQTFSSNRLWKGIFKSGFKILGVRPNEFVGSKLVQISWFPTFSSISAQRSEVSPIWKRQNGVSNYGHFPTRWWKMVYFGLQTNTWW